MSSISVSGSHFILVSITSSNELKKARLEGSIGPEETLRMRLYCEGYSVIDQHDGIEDLHLQGWPGGVGRRWSRYHRIRPP